MPEIDSRFRLPESLSEIILSGRCVAYLGSGLSSTGLYHDWRTVINDLCKHCGIPRRVTKQSPAEDLLTAAQEAKDASLIGYREYLAGHFGRHVDRYSRLYQALLKLPFKCYLTSTFDPSLQLMWRTDGGVNANNVHVYRALNREHCAKRSVHYLHGLIEENMQPSQIDIVLAQGEFDSAYEPDSNLRQFLIPTFEEDPILFIGCRLEEPALLEVFEITKKHQLERRERMSELGLLEGSPPPRYILLDRQVVQLDDGTIDEIESERQEQSANAFYRNLDIDVCWYNRFQNGHGSLVEALETLAKLSKKSPEYGWSE